MIPATGWLAEADNTNQQPELSLLPLPFSFVYGDGPAADIDTAVEEQLTLVERTIGNSGVTGALGLAANVLKFTVTVERSATYAALLLDSILVPAVVPVPEDASDPTLDVEHCPDDFDVESFEACCSVDIGWFYDGTYQYIGERKAGIM